MPAALIPKEEVIARIARTFTTHGYDGASLAELSQQTGLVKASLYHYFPDGKKEMAAAALEAFGASMGEKVVAPLLSKAPPHQRLVSMLDGMNDFYNGGLDLCLFALLSVGDTRDLFQAKITRKVGQLADALTNTLREAGLSKRQAASRAEQCIVEIEGALIVSRVLGDAGVFQRTLKRLREQMP